MSKSRIICRKIYIKLQQISFYKLLRDLFNKTIYGSKSPVYAERLWIDPRDVLGVDHERIMNLGWGFYSSAKIEHQWPFTSGDYYSVNQLPKIAHCVERFINDKSWEASGSYEHYKSYTKTRSGKRKYSDEKIKERHIQFDRMFEMIREEKRLRTMVELDEKNYKEEGGILIHIGPSGELVFSETGSHRLAFAIILGIEKIPVQIGVVHKDAIPLIEKYRETDNVAM